MTERTTGEGLEGGGGGVQRFPRTLRSPRKRARLWRSQDGKCAICGDPMDPDNWEADHAEPWRITQRTNVHEMQATHPWCNRKKG
jgi:5-methylcytosine-specific restriction endonuclease McrA